MKTIICDIDGTLTSLWPLERLVLAELLGVDKLSSIEKFKQSQISETYCIFQKLSKRRLSKREYTELYTQTFSRLLYEKKVPKLEKYPLVQWIKNNSQLHYVYATGGQRAEAIFALQSLGIIGYFDLVSSVDKTTCRFGKKTGVPFKKIKAKYSDCLVLTDSQSDCEGATLAGIPSILIEKSDQRLSRLSKVYWETTMPDHTKRVYRNADEEIIQYDGSPLSWRVSAYVLIVKDGQLLIIKNRREKLHDIPGGGIEFGEHIDEALKREGIEEAGAEFILGELLHVEMDWFYHRSSNFHQTLQLFYQAELVGELQTPTEDDIEWVKFVPFAELKKYRLPKTVEKVIAAQKW